MADSFKTETTSAPKYPEPKAWESAIGLRVELPFVNVGTGKAAREYNEAVASQAHNDEVARGANATSALVTVVTSK